MKSIQPDTSNCKPSSWVYWILCLLVGTTLSCQSQATPDNPSNDSVTLTNQVTISDQLPWSERMAQSVIKRNPEAWMIDFRDSPKWNYTHGLVLLSLLEVWDKTDDDQYFSYVKSFADTLIDEEGSIRGGYDIANFNIDHIKPGNILFDLYEESGDERYLTAMQTLRTQLQWQPRTSEGGFWHKLRYPWQMWLDGLYMGTPFYTEFAVRFDEPAAFDDIANQFQIIEKNAKDANTGLLYHGWDESRVQQWSNDETGLSQCFWARAVGWYAMALVDVLDHYPAEHPRRQELIDNLQRTMEAIAQYQDTDKGLWYQVMDAGNREGNYLESTASCMFVYAMAKGVNKGYLPNSYMDLAKKAYDGILEEFIEVADEGEVLIHKCCAVAGLGGDPYRSGSYEYYINEEIRSNDPKATGPFILASLELEKTGYLSKR